MKDLSFLHPAHLQVLGLGAVWISFHCVPMCGPIVGGLQLSKGSSAWKALFLYQLGRGLVYVVLGALAGGLGSAAFIEYPELGWIIVLILMFLLLQSLFPRLIQARLPNSFVRLWSYFASLPAGPCRPLLLGVVLGFLPCMLTLWALGLAASTKSMASGAFTMFLLILMTSLPLAIVIKGSSYLARAKVEPWLLAISVVWSSLMTLAAQESISHMHIRFDIFDYPIMLMLW